MGGYPSDVTDEQCARIAAFFPARTGLGHRRTVDLRRVVDALLYRLRLGCPWRWLPRDLPDWRSVYYYCGKWTRDGTLEHSHDWLQAEDRAREGREGRERGRRAIRGAIVAGEAAKGEGRGCCSTMSTW